MYREVGRAGGNKSLLSTGVNLTVCGHRTDRRRLMFKNKKVTICVQLIPRVEERRGLDQKRYPLRGRLLASVA